MKTLVRFACSFRSKESLAPYAAYLESKNTPYKISEIDVSNYYLIVEVAREDEGSSEIIETLSKLTFSTISLEFTEEERLSAEWLNMESTNWKVENEYDEFEFFCPAAPEKEIIWGFHHRRVMPIHCRPIKWTNRNHIYGTAYGESDIVCDDHAYKIISGYNFGGLEFAEVFTLKNQVMSNAHHMVYKNELPPEALLPDEAQDKILHCPWCGKIKYDNTHESRIIVKREYLDDKVDFYGTPDMLGFHANAGRRVLVSQRVYRALKENMLTRNLRFEPVIIV